MRSILSILIIAAVLICPFDCAVKRSLAQSAAGMAGSAQTKDCCSNCGHQQHEADPIPSEPTKDPSQDGRCCVCEGAILATIEQATETFSYLVLHWVALETPKAICQQGFSAHPLEDGTALPQLLGRERRISMLSLLL